MTRKYANSGLLSGKMAFLQRQDMLKWCRVGCLNFLPTDCHLVTFRDAGIRYFRKILVYIKQNHVSKTTIDLASHLAQIHDASVTIVSFIRANDTTERLEELREELKLAKPTQFRPQSLSLNPKMKLKRLLI